MSNVVNFPNIRAQRATQHAIDENTTLVRNGVIPELQASLPNYSAAAQQGIHCAIALLNGFLQIGPHMLPLLMVEANQNSVYFSILPRHGSPYGKLAGRYFLKITVTPCTDASPDTVSLYQPDHLLNRVHEQYEWHLGKPMIQPVGFLWSYLLAHDWVFAHHEVDPAAMTITQYWRNEAYQITTIMNHDHLETTVREWQDDDT